MNIKSVICVILSTVLISGCTTKPSIPKQQNDDLTIASAQSQHIDINMLLSAASNVPETRATFVKPSYKKYSNIHSILVACNNKLVFKKYFNGANMNKPHAMASVGKSLISSLVGIAIDEGYLQSENESIYQFLKYAEY